MNVVINRYFRGEDAARRAAFPTGDAVHFSVSVDRVLGVGVPILRVRADGGEDRDITVPFVTTNGISDIYETVLNPSELCGDDGLLYYCFVFPNGRGALFTDTTNNVDFELSESERRRFCMLVYRENFVTPEWFYGRTMYHIFVDRFYRGDGAVKLRDDCKLDENWNGGIPQYGAYAGAPVENNVFFGGNLWGIIEKLDYLVSLGIGIIYLSPVFEAKSNHKYDIGDYLKIDDGFGGEAAFSELLRQAHARGIAVILDGVFNHTGDDSRYFDRYNRYGSGDRYRDWYCRREDGSSEYWWGVTIMPRLNHNNPECRRFFTGDDGVAAKYVDEGIDGWRLDVADELNDVFLDELRIAVKKKSDGNAVIIGEVWENAAEKVSYGNRRKYLRGQQLDGVMNYPVRNAIISFVEYGDSQALYDTLTEIYSVYPRPVCDCLMNLLGTHDTERILTVLGDEPDSGLINDELAKKRMSYESRAKAKKLLTLASVIQYTVFGVPSLYYGDEAGLEGYHDPFCRMPFPWGREDGELLAHYRRLGEIRKKHKAFAGGGFEFAEIGNSFISYKRNRENDVVVVAANRGETYILRLDGRWRDELTENVYENEISVPADTAMILTAEV